MMLTLISGAFVPQAMTVQQYWTLVAVNQTRVAGEKVDGGPLPTPVTTPRSLVWPNTTATTLLYLIIRYIFYHDNISFQVSMNFKVLVYFVIFVKFIISNVFSFLLVLWRKERRSFADPALANLFV